MASLIELREPSGSSPPVAFPGLAQCGPGQPGRVLVLGDDTKAFLAVVRSLGRKGLEIHCAPTDLVSPALHSRYIYGRHSLPAFRGSGDQWAEGLAELVSRHEIDLVIPTSDAGLLMLIDKSERLGRSRLAIPNAKAARIFTDKSATRSLATSCGVPVCQGVMIAPGDAGQAARLPAELGLPFVCKPTRSWRPGSPVGKESARIVRSEDAARFLVSSLAEPWLAESFFAGQGIGLSVLGRDGVILASVQHRRLSEEHETGPSTKRRSEPVDAVLLDWVGRMVAAARLTGVAMFEFRHDPRSGQAVLLEVNARFWGSLPLAVEAGADIPWALWCVHRDREVPRFNYRVGLQKTDMAGEYWRLSGETEATSIRRRLRGAVEVVRAIPTLFDPPRFDSWAHDDPAPFAADRRLIGSQVLSAARRRAFRARAA